MLECISRRVRTKPWKNPRAMQATFELSWKISSGMSGYLALFSLNTKITLIKEPNTIRHMTLGELQLPIISVLLEQVRTAHTEIPPLQIRGREVALALIPKSIDFRTSLLLSYHLEAWF